MKAKRFILMLLVMLGSVTGAWAIDNVPYVDANGQEQTANNVTVINAGNSNRVTWKAGWYVVQGNITFSKGIICSGDVHLILSDGAKLTAKDSDQDAGIRVNGGSATLTIYGQTAQTGSLNATGTKYGGAGIGGGFKAGNGRIIINGGNITATGGDNAAGIGGGNSDSGHNYAIGEDITINGGIVKAYGGYDGAGIGGGLSSAGKNITINGGKVTAIGGYYAAGIGGGGYETASNISITGGDVFAQGGDYANAIGCGIIGNAANGIYVADGLYVRADNQNPPLTLISHTGITHDIASSLNGKTFVRIRSDEHVFGVSYMDADRKSKTTDALMVTDASEQVTWNNDWYVVYGNVNLSQGAICQGNVKLILADGAKLTTTGAANEAGIRVSGVGNSLTIYVQSAQTGQLIATGGTNGAGIGGANGEDGSNITVLSGFITATGGTNASAIGGGAEGSSSCIYVDNRRAVKVGNSANPTTEITHTLTTDIAQQLAGNRYAEIMPSEYMYDVPYVDENGEVQIVAQAHFIAENISEPTTWTEGWYAVYGNVTYSKYLTCTGNIHLILLDDAEFTVSANEWDCHAIAVTGSNPSLTIYGQSCQSGKLKATAKSNGAGINVGSGPITINGGTITATAVSSFYYGISGGKITINDGKITSNGISGTNITINSGEIIATGEYGCSGINGSNGVTIHNGTVKATGGALSSGIGSTTRITINGGVVTATGGFQGAGVGGGRNGNGNNITINGGIITATGGDDGAGIGGGWKAGASNIKINGGEVNATGSNNGTGIGGGQDGSASNIFVNSLLSLRADNNNPPTTVVAHSSDEDVAGKLSGKRYTKVTLHVHEYATEWQHDEHTHWHACISQTGNCDAPLGEEAEHIYNESITCDADNYTCSVCGYVDEAKKAPFEARDYLSMTAVGGDVTIGMIKTDSPANYDMQYSSDRVHWTTIALNESTTLTTIPEGETYYFRHGTAETIGRISSNGNYWTFTMTGTGTIEADGNIMSLLDATVQKNNIGTPFAFANLFKGCASLTKAPKLPATSISERCYKGMFEETGITESPELPAVTVIKGSYENMFKNCQYLETAPELLATYVAWTGYYEMFMGCKKITEVTLGGISTIENGNAFQRWLDGTAEGTTGVAHMPDALVGNISLPSNWTAHSIDSHNYVTEKDAEGNDLWVWDGVTKATLKFVCTKNAKHKAEAVATGGDITNALTTDPTCAVDGVRTYTAKVTFEGVEYIGSKDAAEPMLSHEYQYGVCTRCGETPSHFDEFTINDGDPYLIAHECSIGTLSYSRYYPVNVWSAWFTPFDVNASYLRDNGLTPAYIEGIHNYDDDEDGTIDRTVMEIVKISNGRLRAGTPLLVRAAEGYSEQLNFNDVTMIANTDLNNIHTETATAKYDFIGTFTGTTAAAADNIYSLNTEGAMVHRTGTILPLRWYCQIEQKPSFIEDETPAPALARAIYIRVIGEEDQVTGIRTLYDEANQTLERADGIFDLSGRKLAVPQHGKINIINGKKQFVK